MAKIRHGASLAIFCATAAWLPAQRLKPESLQDFTSYVQAAEARLAARPPSAATAGDAIRIVPGNGPNPHKIRGAMIYDLVGTVFIPGVPLDRVVHMLQDYDHRAEYFPGLVASAKLLCRTGENHFGFTMRIQEPVEADAEYDVVWERLDEHHWRLRSYSGDVRERKPKGYLYRMDSFWSLGDNGRGVVVEAETITLSGEFGSVMRTLGSLAGVNPEKSLRRTLNSIWESVLSHRDFAPPPSGLPQCGAGPSGFQP